MSSVAGWAILTTFHLDGRLFGVEVARVSEVLRPQEMTRVPLAPPCIAGLVNLRGDVVPAIDLRHRLGFPAPPDGQPMTLVVRTGTGLVGLLVDSVGEVLAVPETTRLVPPETVPEPARSLVAGAYKLTSGLMLCLDIDRAVDVSSASRRSSPE